MNYDYDCIIIGAGLSGLAAGIRLAHFGKKIAICERHSRLGGLNSYYSRAGFELETGLHGMTNFARRDGLKSLPLLKLLRQLRIPYESLMAREQNFSLIKFPDRTLRFSNEFNEFENSIAENFPHQIDRFRKLDKAIMAFDEVNLNNPFCSARKTVAKYIDEPLLIDMLFCPLMFYGSAIPEDMDWSQFVIMYKSIFKEGFFRPAGEGIKTVLNILKERFVSSGGELRLNCGIAKINTDNTSVANLTTDKGETIRAKQILSSAGLVETLTLCSPQSTTLDQFSSGELGYLETMVAPAVELDLSAHQETIIFYCNSDRFNYRRPDSLVDTSSGVVCFPNNFQFNADDEVPEKMVRATVLANSPKWLAMDDDAYRRHKASASSAVFKQVEQITGIEALTDNARLLDAFTPRTILRYTGHLNGAIYGSPDKARNGKTQYDNLFICGTDQGFLGITGAMLSGISIANMYLLR
jgi:phytoene dehydrogenase-like protein